MALSSTPPTICLLLSITLCLAAAKSISPQSGISPSRDTTLTPNSLGSPSWSYQDYLDQYSTVNLRLQGIYSNYSAVVLAMGSKLTDNEKQQLANLLLLSIQVEANFNVTRLSRHDNPNIRLFQKLKLWNKQSSLSKAIKTQEANIGKYISKEEASHWKIQYVQNLKNSLSSAASPTRDSQNPQEAQTSSNAVEATPSAALMDCNTSLVCVKYQAQIDGVRGRIAVLKDQAISAIIASMVGMSTPGPLRQSDLVVIKSLSAQANQAGIDLASKITTINADPSATTDVKVLINQFAQTVSCELNGLKITFFQIINPTASSKVSDIPLGVAPASSFDGSIHSPLTANQTGQALSSISNAVSGAAPSGGADFAGSIMSRIANFAQNVQQPQQQQNPVGNSAGMRGGNQSSISLSPPKSQMSTYSLGANSFAPSNYGSNPADSSQQLASSFSNSLSAGSPLIAGLRNVVTGDVDNSSSLAPPNTLASSSSLSSQAASILKSFPSSIPVAPVPSSSRQATPRVLGPTAPPSSRQINPNGLN